MLRRPVLRGGHFFGLIRPSDQIKSDSNQKMDGEIGHLCSAKGLRADIRSTDFFIRHAIILRESSRIEIFPVFIVLVLTSHRLKLG